jgi:hypothetical protein
MIKGSAVLKAAVLAAGLAAGTARADMIGYLSNLVGPSDTEVNYTLTLPKFNPSLGTLTAVTIYFYASENVTKFELTNTSGSTQQTFGAAATADLTSGMQNDATSGDVFPLSYQALVYFDTGIATEIGNCSENGTTVEPNQCSSLIFNALQTIDYAPFSFANTDSVYVNDPTAQSNGLTVGTGAQGLTGVILTGTSISNYSGAGNWNLTGATLNFFSLSGAGGNVAYDIQTEATIQAEVDYTYTPAAVPEPMTTALMGSALLGLAILRNRITK